jgi:hypothetical protein
VYHTIERCDNNEASIVEDYLAYNHRPMIEGGQELPIIEEARPIMKLAKHRLISCLCLGMTLLAGCAGALTGGNTNAGPFASGRGVALGEEFKLQRDEKTSVKQTSLAIELKGVRRTWYVDGKSETVDADVILTLNGKEQRQWISFRDPARIGEFEVKLTAANPFGKNDATLVVHRIEVSFSERPGLCITNFRDGI